MSTKSPEDHPSRLQDLLDPLSSEEFPAAIDNWDGPGGQPCTVYRDGPDSLGRVTTPLGDLRFANLYGRTTAMARQLGRRSSMDIREGSLQFLDHFLGDIVDTLVPPAVLRLGQWATENWLTQRLLQGFPPDYLNTLRAFGEGTGVEDTSLLRSQLVWDLWGLSGHLSLQRLATASARFRSHSPLLGSASLVLPTDHDGPLHMRWLDNAAVDRWDRKTLVSFFHPDRGLSYVLVSSVGFFTGLPAGMNAAGLTLSVEPGQKGRTSLSGTPLGPAAHEILRSAHTLEEAAAILRQFPSMVPWRYVLTEGDTGRAAMLFTDATGVRRESFDQQAFAITAADPGVPRDQAERIERWYRGRREAVDIAVTRWRANNQDALFTALEEMARPLSSSAALPGHPLCGPSNVGALVFEPASRRFWVAAGRAPSGRRWFVPFTMRSASGSGGGVDRRVRPVKPGFDWDETHQARALENLRHAYRMFLNGEPPQRVLITLEYALALDSSRPAFHILAGLMALKTGRGQRAQGAFERAIQLLKDPGHRAEVGVYLAWALDLQGDRRAAKKLHHHLAKDPTAEKEILKWARRGQRRRFRESHAQKLQIDFVLATAFF